MTKRWLLSGAASATAAQTSDRLGPVSSEVEIFKISAVVLFIGVMFL
jgi:hypothetical protein